jgi:copper transport protein
VAATAGTAPRVATLHLVRRAPGVLLVVVIALAAAPAALAHARLLATEPADGANVATAPAAVRLFFDEAVALAPGNAVVAADHRSVLAGQPRLERRHQLLVLPLARIGNGDYSVSWRVFSDDGHLEAGVLAFRVGPGTAGSGAPTPVLAVASTRPGALDVLARWLFLGGILFAGGTALFALLVSRAAAKPAAATMTVALSGAVLGGAWLVNDVGGATRFTHVVEAVVVVAAAGAILAALAAGGSRIPFVAALALSLVLLLAPTLAGHAFRAWGGRPLSVGADLVHVAAAAFWTGGLLQLLLLLRAGGDERAVRRFSLFALPAVALIAVTGLARALVELTAVSQLWTTGYGRAILIKSALLGVLVLLGWASRRALADPQRLRRSVVAELALLVLLVGVVGVLTALRPGRDASPAATASPVREVARAPAPPPGSVVFAHQAQELAVGLAVRSGSPLRLTATVIGQTGNGVDGLDVRLSGGSGSRTVTAAGRPCGHGCYVADIPLASPTRFGVVIAGSGPVRTLRFPVRLWPPPSGAAYLRRATRSFGKQQSVVYTEHLASDPTHAITTTWKLEAPGSVAYSIAEGGAQGIVIGLRRWDRPSPSAPWTLSASERLVQPAPPWGPRARDARVMRRSASTVTLSWVDPVIPAWYTATFARATALPTTLRMTAPAHFMLHRYLAFNGPLQIRPPTG